MKIIDKVNHIIFQCFLGTAVKLIGMVMVLTIVLQVFGRYLLTVPFPWTEELSRLTFVWFGLLGAVVTLSENGHLGIDYFYRKCGPKMKWILEIITWICILVVSLIIVRSGIAILGIVAKQKTAIFRISYVYSYASVPVSGFFMAIYSALSLIRAVFFHHLRETARTEG